MIYLRLFWEFFKIGLFAVGGGGATLPFITELGNRTGWYTELDVADMLGLKISALTAASNVDLLEKQIRKY